MDTGLPAVDSGPMPMPTAHVREQASDQHQEEAHANPAPVCMWESVLRRRRRPFLSIEATQGAPWHWLSDLESPSGCADIVQLVTVAEYSPTGSYSCKKQGVDAIESMTLYATGTRLTDSWTRTKQRAVRFYAWSSNG